MANTYTQIYIHVVSAVQGRSNLGLVASAVQNNGWLNR